jgi:signal transduction histidine kinase
MIMQPETGTKNVNVYNDSLAGEMYSIALDIVSQLNLDMLLTKVVQRAATFLNISSVFLFLYDKETDKLKLVSEWNSDKSYIGIYISKESCIAGNVIQTGKPIIINDYKNWEYRYPKESKVIYKSAMGTPLQWGDRIIGAMTVANQDVNRVLDDFDLQQLASYAGLASIAINNAKLYRKTQKLNEELERHNAKKTQQLTVSERELSRKNAELQTLLNRITYIQEEERSRIAQDMHDDTLQLIYGAAFANQAAMSGLKSNSGTVIKNLEKLQDYLTMIEKSIRETIGNLRPFVVDDGKLPLALKKYLEDYKKRSEINCELEIFGDSKLLDKDKNIVVFRIVQEALLNVFTHAQAKNVKVVLNYDNDHVLVAIEDDGIGIDFIEADKNQLNDHYGMRIMRSRAEGIGGALKIDSAPGKGTFVQLKIPIS